MSLDRIGDLRDWRSCLNSIRQQLEFPGVEARARAGGREITELMWASYDQALSGIAEGMLHTVIDLQQPAEAAAELEQFAAELAALQLDPAAELARGSGAKAFRELCRDFAQVQRGLPAVVETFKAYAEGHCRLSQEPEDLLKEAGRRLPTEPQAALGLVGEVGCLCLRGLGEAEGLPLHAGRGQSGTMMIDWLSAVAGVVGCVAEKLQEYPLGEMKLARDQQRSPEDSRRIEYKKGKLARLGVVEPEIQVLLIPLFAPQKQRLSTAERQAIIEAGPGVVPGLIAIASDYDSQLVASVSEGEAALRAVELLGDMRAAEAVPALLGILKDSDWMLIIHDEALRALQDKMPDLAFPTALEVFDHTPDSEFKSDLAGILAKGGRGTSGVFERLIKYFREAKKEHDLLAICLADLGDPRALPDLHEALRKAGDWMAVGEIEAAIVELGGELSAAEQEKVQRLRPTPLLARLSPARPPQATQSAEMGQARVAKIGRNEPCPCGSGKKYKKCHGR